MPMCSLPHLRLKLLAGVLVTLMWITSASAQNRVLELDGDDSWVELPAELLKDVKNELTVEGWIRWERLGNFSRFFDFGPVWRSVALSQVSDSAGLQCLLHQDEYRVRIG